MSPQPVSCVTRGVSLMGGQPGGGDGLGSRHMAVLYSSWRFIYTNEKPPGTLTGSHRVAFVQTKRRHRNRTTGAAGGTYHVLRVESPAGLAALTACQRAQARLSIAVDTVDQAHDRLLAVSTQEQDDPDERARAREGMHSALMDYFSALETYAKSNADMRNLSSRARAEQREAI